MHRLAIGAVMAGMLAGPGPAASQVPAGTVEVRVALDNETVRVALHVFPPGSASGRHVGLEPEMGIVVEGELTLVTDAGREVLRPGSVHWLPALVPHDARNESDQPVTLWVVFFKRCD